jgi:hypothetical protein
MMGYKIPNRKLVIELADYEGAEVTCKLDVKMKTFFDLQDLTSDNASIISAYTTFGNEILESWNFENESGESIPADATGMLDIPPAIAIALMNAWTEQVSSGGMMSSTKSQSGDTLGTKQASPAS